MTKIQSHADCTHENSKAARAKCRRSRARFAAELALAFSEPAAVVIETPEPAFKPVDVTRENWKEFALQPVVLFTIMEDEDEEAPIAEGVKIIGWGKQWVDYKLADGKVKRTSAKSLGARTMKN